MTKKFFITTVKILILILSDFLFVKFAGLAVGDGAILAVMTRAVGAS